MIPSFLLIAILQKPVVLPDWAMRLDALLKAMSDATGERHHADPALRGRIEIVAGPTRAADLIRADLALANSARWTHDVDGWTLEEDASAVKAREAARLALRTEAVRRAGADGLARAVVGRELRPDSERYDGMPKTIPALYRFGRRIYPQLKVALGPTLRWSQSVSSPEFDARQKPRPLDALPPAFLKTYRDALDRYRKDPSQLGP